LIAVVIIGAPAAVLRSLCVGRACTKQADAASEVPFCSLPTQLRDLLATGFRKGRSAEVLAVARHEIVSHPANGRDLAWPSLESTSGRVPIVFWGTGVDPAAEVPRRAPLTDVAPTIAEMIGLVRPHPEVRSGTALDEVAAGTEPRLVLLVVLKGIGSAELERDPSAWPHLRSMLVDGAGTLDGVVGSLPLDPVSALTTIGTGAPPSQHGVTGELVRNEEGELVRAWSRRAEVSVVATLGDDLDEKLNQRPRIGLVATSSTDEGLVGGRWYIDVDTDDFTLGGRRPSAAAARVLERGYGKDGVVDLLAVALESSVKKMDAELDRLVAAAEAAAGGSLAVVVAAAGAAPPAPRSALTSNDVVERVEETVATDEDIVEGATAGGLFLDQEVLADESLSEDAVIRALGALEDDDGTPLMADAFSATAVSFERYC
jgi:hypothetical protein